MKVRNPLATAGHRQYKYERLDGTEETSTERSLRGRNLLFPLVIMSLSLAAIAALLVSG